MRVPSLSPSEKAAVGGGVLAAVGSVLPWVRAADATVTGLYLDGFLVVMAALSVVGVVALWRWGPVQQAVTALLGVLVIVLTGNHAMTIATSYTGVGTYVAFVAGVLIAGAGVYGYAVGRQTAEGIGEQPQ